MIADWHPLEAELKHWQLENLTLPIWWRDDDAVTVTLQLDTLNKVAEDLGVPVHLAVVPCDADADLAGFVEQAPQLVPVVHGWAHKNHAPPTEKKSEFRLHRPLTEAVEDARHGMARLQDLFGNRLCPMFVPPWNRVAQKVVEELPGLGFRILSTATPRKAALAAPGLLQVNTHLDPIDWKGTRGLVDPDVLVAQVVDLLKDRRLGRTDNAEAFGILTHHLVHTPDVWTFTQSLIQRLLDGPGQVWTATETLNNYGDHL
ncbi:MAG: polysaccharide deacetylase family protein [Ruegeria sp.]